MKTHYPSQLAKLFPTRALTAAAAALTLTLTGTSDAATIYIYDMTTDVGPAGTVLSTDGWSGTNVSNWKTNNFDTELYARNNNSADDTINRPNDGSFSFSIPTGTTQVNLEVRARSGPNFFQVGLSDGTTQRFGVGADFGLTDDAFIFDNGTRRVGTTDTVTGDVNSTFRVEFDLVNGTADLLQDGNLLLDDQAMSLTAGALEATDSLFIRTGNEFVGPSTITIEVVPEPSSLALLGLGGLCLVRRRRA